MLKNPWSRNELILVLHYYYQNKKTIPDTTDPDIASISSLLAELAIIDENGEGGAGKSKKSIIFKLNNFRCLDPKVKNSGKSKLKNYGNSDKSIWKEYENNLEELVQAASEIKQNIASKRKEINPLRANLHILRLLGDELIGSPRLAIFELVKNAYDADSEIVHVTLDVETDDPTITIHDNGCGMSLDTIRDGWLQIGTPSKRKDHTSRTPKFNRMHLGEKGVGRLAAFKVGDRIELFTREKGGKEYNLVIDLDRILDISQYDQNSSIEDVRVRVKTLSKPQVHTGKNDHGTLIKITKLRQDLDWSKRELRELQRLVNSISSPFEKIGEFETILEVPGRKQEIEDLPDVTKVLEHAIWVYRFKLTEEAKLKWFFRFHPPAVFRGLSKRKLNYKDVPNSNHLAWTPLDPEPDMPVRPRREKIFVTPDDLRGIGPLSGRFYVFDLRPTVLKHLGSKAVKMILENQGGVRVYRDNIRVFNYGEPGDDWLGLNLRRVNRPGEALATNAVVAAIELDLDKSKGLKEKTNREGFDENETYKRFHMISNSLVDHLNTLRQQDRKDIDSLLKGDKIRDDAPLRFNKAVNEILAIAKKKGIQKHISKPVERIKKEYETLQEVVVSSGAGLNLAIVFHEVEREVRAIAKGLKKGEKVELLNTRAETLITILDGFKNLLEKASRKTILASTLVKRVAQLSQGRFQAHKILFTAPILNGEETDFEISGAINFYFTTLLNIIDNAIYWVRRRSEIEGEKAIRAIQIRLLPDWAAEGPCLAVLDNGPGFSISPDEALRPYASTRPGGMGLGLYFGQTAMDANGGDLLIPSDIEDLDIKTDLNGSAVVMRFRKVK